MTKYIICCEKCYNYLLKKDSKIVDFWKACCQITAETDDIFYMTECNFPEMRALEMLGYIVTTDCDEVVGIQIQGHIYTEDKEHFFCAKGGNHE